MSRWLDALAIAQGVYYLATGVWPLVGIRSFEVVTGPKTDLWLVRTVGVLIAVIGVALLAAGVRGAVTPEIVILAAGSAAGLAAIDVVYAAVGRISRIYLLDAVPEALLALVWIVAALVR